MRHRRNHLVVPALTPSAVVKAIRTQLPDSVAVTLDGTGYRIKCRKCGWFRRNGQVQQALNHVDTH